MHTRSTSLCTQRYWEVSRMSEEKKQEILDELKEALAGVPEKYHKEVAAALTHDAGVIARTISMVEKAPG